MTTLMIQRREEWIDALIELNDLGKLSDGALLAALRMSKDMWMVNPPGLKGTTGAIISRINMTKAVYYRHVRELTSLGFLTKQDGHLITPVLPEDDSNNTPIVNTGW